mmetsp:Transcript_8978/g.9327  ORF Transcript_8978/g.9327 Transcript_8978/m.9327 type:complete len:338 (+) Transcript_8978:41-1054(+)
MDQIQSLIRMNSENTNNDENKSSNPFSPSFSFANQAKQEYHWNKFQSQNLFSSSQPNITMPRIIQIENNEKPKIKTIIFEKPEKQEKQYKHQKNGKQKEKQIKKQLKKEKYNKKKVCKEIEEETFQERHEEHSQDDSGLEELEINKATSDSLELKEDKEAQKHIPSSISSSFAPNKISSDLDKEEDLSNYKYAYNEAEKNLTITHRSFSYRKYVLKLDFFDNLGVSAHEKPRLFDKCWNRIITKPNEFNICFQSIGLLWFNFEVPLFSEDITCKYSKVQAEMVNDGSLKKNIDNLIVKIYQELEKYLQTKTSTSELNKQLNTLSKEYGEAYKKLYNN